MKRNWLLLALIAAVAIPSLFGEQAKPRVAVITPVNRTGEKQYDSVSEAVKDTIFLTLQFINKYEVTTLPIGEAEDPTLLALNREMDTVIFGEVSPEPGSACVIRLSVFDRAKGAVILEKRETAHSILDVFDVSDRIIISLLEAFSGIHIAYGSLSLQLDGAGTYQVFVNGTLIGWNLVSLPRLLIGTYRMDIVQERPFEKVTLFSGAVEIKQNENTELNIAIPSVTETEVGEFFSIDQFIFNNWYDTAEKQEITAMLAETAASTANRWGEGFSFLEKKYRGWKELYASKITADNPYLQQKASDWWHDQPGYGRLIDPSMLPSPGEASGGSAGTLAAGGNDAGFHQVSLEPVGYASALRQEMKVALEERNQLPKVSSGAISVDGRDEDWLFIPPIIEDRTGDTSGRGGDIKLVQMAEDGTYLYLRIETGEERMISFESLWYEVFVSIDGGDNINFNCAYWDEAWHTTFGWWKNNTKTYLTLSQGTVVASAKSLEYRFRLSDVNKYLNPGQSYSTAVQSGKSSSQLDRASESRYIQY